jgi:hypothetical protein
MPNKTINLVYLKEMVIGLIKLEDELEAIEWENEDKIQEYNEIIDNIIEYLKGVQWD